MLALLGWGGTGDCSKFLAISHLLSPMLLLKCHAGAVLVLSCSAGATSLFFYPFFFCPAWCLLWRVKGRRQHPWALHLISSNLTPSPGALQHKKNVTAYTLRRSQTNMEAEGTEPWMFILVQSVLGLTFTHEYLCSASWEPLFASVRDETISSWRHVKVMLNQFTAAEYQGRSFQAYKVVPWESILALGLFWFFLL